LRQKLKYNIEIIYYNKLLSTQLSILKILRNNEKIWWAGHTHTDVKDIFLTLDSLLTSNPKRPRDFPDIWKSKKIIFSNFESFVRNIITIFRRSIIDINLARHSKEFPSHVREKMSEKVIEEHLMKNIRSKKHTVFVVKMIPKVKDDNSKRYYLPVNIYTLAFGHYVVHRRVGVISENFSEIKNLLFFYRSENTILMLFFLLLFFLLFSR
jgi:hypothetical protein